MPAKPKPDPRARWAVRATNDLTGEIWSIHDTRETCEAELVRVLDEWDQPDARVEWANLETETKP